MKKLLCLCLSLLLCFCIALPAPAARAEQGSVTIYSMLLFLIQSFQTQPVAAYDVTDMLTGTDVVNTSETVIGFMMHKDWLLLSGLNGAGEYAATIFVYEDSSFLVLLQALAGTYDSLQAMTSRAGERLVIEVTFEEGSTYVFDSSEEAQALAEVLSE